jgi:AAA15 family ATPase/GTPase
MLTRVTIRNFKGLDEAIVDLAQSVVLVGPNNSGKTSTLQALALWEMGLRQWLGKRQSLSPSDKRSGVSLNRRDLVSVPTPEANLLWRNKKIQTRDTDSQTRVRIEIIVAGRIGAAA